MESDSEPENETIQIPVPTDPVEVLKTGWLTKEGGSHKSLKKRWFVLTKTAFKYYETEKHSGSSLGVIVVRRVFDVSKAEETKIGHPFQIKTRERIFLFFAATAEEQDAWVTALKALVPPDARENSVQVLKSGYLTKQGGGFKSWKKRWFVLTKDNVLSYYHEQGDVVPLREIDLERTREIHVLDPQKGIGFELITLDRIYAVHAANKEELDGWISVITPIIESLGTLSHQLRVTMDDDEDITVSAEEIATFIKTDTKITKQGFLVKQGAKFKTWKKRWFILRESTLAYYRDEKETEPLGLILLKDCKSFELASKKVNKPYAFEFATPERTFFCFARSEDEMWEWINVLSDAVTKAKGKESLEFIALKKAAELAQRKKELQIQIYRKATAKNVRKKISRFRNAQNKKVITPKAVEDTNWTKELQAEGQKDDKKSSLETREQKMLEDLDKLSESKKSDLTESIQAMEKDIAQLNSQLHQRRIIEEDDDDDDEEEEGEDQFRRRTIDGIQVYGRAILDFSPNAYDDEAIGFQKGDILLIEKKDSAGNWTGRIVRKANGTVVTNSKNGTFPYRYVEELDVEPDLTAAPPLPAVEDDPSAGWTDELDSTVGSLFEMYDGDGDGFMTKLDFFEFLYEFGKTHLSDERVDKCWETLDEKQTGKVDSLMFRRGVRKLEALDFHAAMDEGN